MQLPAPRGPLSSRVLDHLSGATSAVEVPEGLLQVDDPVTHGDLQLSLWVLYELHYRGFEGVDDRYEWDPELLRVRRVVEDVFEAALRRRTHRTVTRAAETAEASGDVAATLFEMTASFESRSVAAYIQRKATREELLEFLMQRSVFHLKESDPSSWAIPRLEGAPKVAFVELQYDEYGAGRPDRLHSAMFATTMRECGLAGEYGVYLDQASALTLAVNNAMSMFGLHRRLRGAGMGHLGAFEATSSMPARKLAAGMRRLGFSDAAAEYFDEHVEADAVHEQLAFRDICAALVADEPGLLGDVLFGVAVCLHLEAEAGEELLQCWERGGSTLRPTGLPESQAVPA